MYHAHACTVLCTDCDHCVRLTQMGRSHMTQMPPPGNQYPYVVCLFCSSGMRPPRLFSLLGFAWSKRAHFASCSNIRNTAMRRTRCRYVRLHSMRHEACAICLLILNVGIYRQVNVCKSLCIYAVCSFRPASSAATPGHAARIRRASSRRLCGPTGQRYVW